MELPRLIAITGKKFNGKTSVANILNKTYNYNIVSFAEPLKNACKEIFQFSEDQVNGNLKESIDTHWKKTPREILQFIGTELFRDRLYYCLPWIKQDIWIEVLNKKLMSAWENDKNAKFVITDLRFINEELFVRNHNAIIVKVHRNKPISSIYKNHNSEIEMNYINADIDIYNNFETLDELEVHIYNLVESKLKIKIFI